MGTKITSKIDVTFERRFLKTHALAAAGASFFRFRGWKLGAKSDPKSFNKMESKMEYFGFGLGAILVDFWRQVGRQNRPKLDLKRHRKNYAKKQGIKMAKISL